VLQRGSPDRVTLATRPRQAGRRGKRGRRGLRRPTTDNAAVTA